MSSSHDDSRKIGQLNGPWSILLRLALASYPLILAWAVWMTSNQFADIAFRNSGERFTKADALVLRSDMVDRISSANEWRNDVLTRLARIESKIDSDNSNNHH